MPEGSEREWIWNLMRGAPSFRGADCPGGVLVRAGPRPAVAKAQRGQKKRKRKRKAYSTRYSQAVSHPSTNQARPCLASEIRRDRARSGWYGRRRRRVVSVVPQEPAAATLACAPARQLAPTSPRPHALRSPSPEGRTDGLTDGRTSPSNPPASQPAT